MHPNLIQLHAWPGYVRLLYAKHANPHYGRKNLHVCVPCVEVKRDARFLVSSSVFLASVIQCKFNYRIVGNIRGVQISFYSLLIYNNENLTHKTYVKMGMFSRVKWTE